MSKCERPNCCKRRLSNLNEVIALNSVLHTKASAEADSSAKDDLTKPDPAPEIARAALDAYFEDNKS